MNAIGPGLVILAFSATALPLSAGEASGRFLVGARSISPRSATAYEVREHRDARRKAVELMLSHSALPEAELTAALDPHSVAINSPAAREGDYILLWVHGDGSVSMNATFSGSMTQYLATTRSGLRAELTESSAERVSGRIFTTKPLRTMSGEAYEIDVTFAAGVLRPASGSRLPPGGGAPGEALTGLYGAVARRDYARMRAAVTPRVFSFIAEDEWRSAKENLDNAVDTLRMWLPPKSAITGGELRGDTAVLEVEGEIFPGARALYLIRMMNLGEGWLYDQTATAGFLK
jgi:hypothetical protein